MNKPLFLLVGALATSACSPPEVGTVRDTGQGVEVGPDGVLDPACAPEETDADTRVDGFAETPAQLVAELIVPHRIRYDGPEPAFGELTLSLGTTYVVAPGGTCARSLVFQFTGGDLDLEPSMRSSVRGWGSLGANLELQLVLLGGTSTGVLETTLDTDTLLVHPRLDGTLSESVFEGTLQFEGCPPVEEEDEDAEPVECELEELGPITSIVPEPEPEPEPA